MAEDMNFWGAFENNTLATKAAYAKLFSSFQFVPANQKACYDKVDFCSQNTII